MTMEMRMATAAGVRKIPLEKSTLPGLADAHAEAPACGDAGLVAAVLSGALVLRAIERVAIDGSRGGVEPDAGRVAGLCDGLREDGCGARAGVEDLAAMRCGCSVC